MAIKYGVAWFVNFTTSVIDRSDIFAKATRDL